MGHSPTASLSPQDETLFRAFQSNLLSLISHELRTPLMGILNALGLLNEEQKEEQGGTSSGIPPAELIRMAHDNAQRLHRTLVALLDLAALESGTFHARLREVELGRVVSSRVQAHQVEFKQKGVGLEDLGTAARTEEVVLADPQKLGRALDLCLQILAPRVASPSAIQVRISSAQVSFQAQLNSGIEKLWDTAWSQALAGYQGGVASPGSAFAGVMQSEQAFLSRMEEGLGSEFLLLHEILRLHRGSFQAVREGSSVTLTLALPPLSSVEGLQAVLSSRAYDVSTELSTVALILIQLPPGADLKEFTQAVRKTLFRSSDAVYALPERGQVALVLDDCKPDVAPRLIQRIASTQKLRFGVAQCPTDGLDPGLLLPLAESRLKASI